MPVPAGMRSPDVVADCSTERFLKLKGLLAVETKLWQKRVSDRNLDIEKEALEDNFSKLFAFDDRFVAGLLLVTEVSKATGQWQLETTTGYLWQDGDWTALEVFSVAALEQSGNP